MLLRLLLEQMERSLSTQKLKDDLGRADAERANGGATAFFGAPVVQIVPLSPALASIPDACRYVGGPSRAKFYADILPLLDVVKLGGRTMVTVESLDRLIATIRRPAAA